MFQFDECWLYKCVWGFYIDLGTRIDKYLLRKLILVGLRLSLGFLRQP